MDALLRRRIMMQGGAPELVYYDRLVFDGTAYIDTDIVPGALYTFRFSGVGNETQKVAQRVFGFAASSSKYTRLFYNSSTTTTNRKFGLYYDSSSSLNATLSTDILAFSQETYALVLTPYRLIAYDVNSTYTGGGSGTPLGPLVIGQVDIHSGQAFTGEMGKIRIYGSDAKDIRYSSQLDNFTPVYTLQPCTYNGEAGYWCDETSTFYGNSAGSGLLNVRNIS